MKINNKLSLVVDGNYLMFNSFYATYYGPGEIMSTKDGIPTNGINTFLIQLAKLIAEFKPTYLFVAFDADSKTKRHAMLPTYKDGRAKAPEEIHVQFNLIKEILTLLDINWAQKSGYEADDLVATYCEQIEGTKLIYSRDKDLLQLVKNNVYVIDKKQNSYSLITDENFFDHYQMYPHQITSFKGLKGDPSDNLPGITGIGDKTAIKLLSWFDNFEGIFNNINDSRIAESVRKKLLTGEQQGKMCYEMAQLILDVPEFDSNINNYQLSLNINKALDKLQSLELKTATKYLMSANEQ
ncbi:5'-3' exonuclease H3TH domain-containing protein [Mycoplasma corogypsi]|uniref:5'-3' exonuclease n=1 Tax=Mycoplasma corogypsi TaxID=2106 RepID=UPI003872B7CC